MIPFQVLALIALILLSRIFLCPATEKKRITNNRNFASQLQDIVFVFVLFVSK